ncbi:MAG: ribonuclease H-like domain-containing protein [Lachnospiraceae bacterium]|nr:ribonuclease H-like domain-containing protein [Lachnospiraceae bacterium]
MLQIKKEIPCSITHSLKPDSFFLALDTTGFQAEVSAISMIGIAIPVDHQTITIYQWFNENGMEQQEILSSFFQYIKHKKYVITYYGNRFALPFLDKKSAEYGLSNPLSTIISEDYYAIMRTMRPILGLPSCKQATIESYFQCKRTNPLVGKKLVKQYQTYVKNPNDAIKDALLLHNQETLEILCSLTSILSYQDLQNGKIHDCKIENVANNYISFTFALPSTLLKPMDYTKNYIQLHVIKHQGQLLIPVDPNGLVKHYYPNPKDYYYLPVEDYAIHKSLASFVSNNYRQKATLDTCYEKISIQHPAFKKEPTLKQFLSDTLCYLFK